MSTASSTTSFSCHPNCLKAPRLDGKFFTNTCPYCVLHLNIRSSVSGFEFDCCSHSLPPASLYSLSSPTEISQYGLPSRITLSNLNGFPIRFCPNMQASGRSCLWNARNFTFFHLTEYGAMAWLRTRCFIRKKKPPDPAAWGKSGNCVSRPISAREGGFFPSPRILLASGVYRRWRIFSGGRPCRPPSEYSSPHTLPSFFRSRLSAFR